MGENIQRGKSIKIKEVSDERVSEKQYEVKVYQKRHIYLVGVQNFEYIINISTQGELSNFEVSSDYKILTF